MEQKNNVNKTDKVYFELINGNKSILVNKRIYI